MTRQSGRTLGKSRMIAEFIQKWKANDPSLKHFDSIIVATGGVFLLYRRTKSGFTVRVRNVDASRNLSVDRQAVGATDLVVEEAQSFDEDSWFGRSRPLSKLPLRTGLRGFPEDLMKSENFTCGQKTPSV